MSIFIITYLLSRSILISRETPDAISFTGYFLFIIDIFYLSGEPISPYLLRCKGFAVEYPRPGLTRFIHYASHLRQSQLVNSPGCFKYTFFPILNPIAINMPISIREGTIFHHKNMSAFAYNCPLSAQTAIV